MKDIKKRLAAQHALLTSHLAHHQKVDPSSLSKGSQEHRRQSADKERKRKSKAKAADKLIQKHVQKASQAFKNIQKKEKTKEIKNKIKF